MVRNIHPLVPALAAALLIACGGNNNSPPTAYPGTVVMDEDSEFAGLLTAADAESPDLRYEIVSGTKRGKITLVPAAGTFQYKPDDNFFGTDSFQFAVSDGEARSLPATVSFTVLPVNDAPTSLSIEDQQNSAYTLQTTVLAPFTDVDGDALSVAAASSDTAVAEVEVQGGSIVITPNGRGTADITLTATDGELSAETSFKFNVTDVTRTAVIKPAEMGVGLISLRNASDRNSTFTLTYNGFEAFTSTSDAARHVEQMSAEFPGEIYARKLWRFVRDNTYHDAPLTTHSLWNDMWTSMNSAGWGLCSHVSVIFVQLANAAGYDARVWELNGHVVPEILVDGRWEMYDPDLAAYYLDDEGRVASVEQLASDPTLITNPRDPILPQLAVALAGPYQQGVANIYASKNDNFVNPSDFRAPDPWGATNVTLPPAAQLLLPGRWTDRPVGYDGTIPGQIQEFRQAKMRLPPGWTGTLPMPWALWELQGTGVVHIHNRTYDVDSTDLGAYLKTPNRAIVDIQILSNPEGLDLIFFINALWYELLEENHVSINGLDTWAIDIGVDLDSPGLHASPFPENLRKPRPQVP